MQAKLRPLPEFFWTGRRQIIDLAAHSTATNKGRHLSVVSAAPPTPTNDLCKRMQPFRSNSEQEGFSWRSPYGQIAVPEMRVEDYVWKNLDMWHNKIAIVCGITGRQYSYGKLRDHSAALAYRLRANFDLKPGDVVAISMPNVPEYAIVALGAFEAGLTITTINPNYTSGWYFNLNIKTA